MKSQEPIVCKAVYISCKGGKKKPWLLHSLLARSFCIGMLVAGRLRQKALGIMCHTQDNYEEVRLHLQM